VQAAAFRRRRPLLTPIYQMYLAMFFVCVAASMTSATFPPYVRASGYDVATVGFLVSVYSVMSLASRLPAGALAAGRRSHLVAVGATALFAMSTAAYAVAGDLASFTVIRALNGFAYGVITTVNMALLMEAIHQPERRASATGWYLGWIAAGHATGGFLSGLVVDHLGFHTAYLLLAVVIVVGLPFSVARGAPTPGARGMTPSARLPSGVPWRAALSVTLLIPALQGFTLNALSQVMWTFYPLYGLSVGLTLTALGVHAGGFSTTSMIARALVGQVSHRVSYRQVGTISLSATAVLTMLVPLFSAFLPLLVLNVMLGALRAGALVGSMVATFEFAGADARKRGMAAGVYSFGSDSAMVGAPLVGGLIAEQIGLDGIFWALPAALMTIYFGLLGGSLLVARAQR
jgi:MFS family permease